MLHNKKTLTTMLFLALSAILSGTQAAWAQGEWVKKEGTDAPRKLNSRVAQATYRLPKLTQGKVENSDWVTPAEAIKLKKQDQYRSFIRQVSFQEVGPAPPIPEKAAEQVKLLKNADFEESATEKDFFGPIPGYTPATVDPFDLTEEDDAKLPLPEEPKQEAATEVQMAEELPEKTLPKAEKKKDEDEPIEVRLLQPEDRKAVETVESPSEDPLLEAPEYVVGCDGGLVCNATPGGLLQNFSFGGVTEEVIFPGSTSHENPGLLGALAMPEIFAGEPENAYFSNLFWGSIDCLWSRAPSASLPVLVRSTAAGNATVYGESIFDDVMTTPRYQLGFRLGEKSRFAALGEIYQQEGGANASFNNDSNVEYLNPWSAGVYSTLGAGETLHIGAKQEFTSGSAMVQMRLLCATFDGDGSLLQRLAMVDRLGLFPPAKQTIRLDCFSGYRYYGFDDELSMQLESGGAMQPRDVFTANNSFHGGVLGLQWQYERGNLYAKTTTMVTFGGTRNTLQLTDGSASSVENYQEDQFTVIPELRVLLGLDISRCLSIYGSYDVLFWSNVVRAPEQIANLSSASFQPLSDDFWVNSGSVGMELRW